jgi:hypothetical protein
MAKDNVQPINPKERHTWKCDVPRCKARGTVANKRDVKLALALHKALVH